MFCTVSNIVSSHDSVNLKGYKGSFTSQTKIYCILLRSFFLGLFLFPILFIFLFPTKLIILFVDLSHHCMLPFSSQFLFPFLSNIDKILEAKRGKINASDGKISLGSNYKLHWLGDWEDRGITVTLTKES